MSEQFADDEGSNKPARADLQIYRMSIFRSAKDHQFRPRRGTMMDSLWSQGRLSIRHQRAWRIFCDDLHGWAGKSGKVTGSYGESTGGSGNAERMPVAYVSPEWERLQRCCANLSRMETALIRDMITEELEGVHSLQIELVGMIATGYGNESQQRAAGVSRVLALLERIADHYQL